jgi:putative nucleotidyltransferase with HDIG domain
MVTSPAFRIDAVLTPVALMLAATAEAEPVALAGVAPLLWLFRVFSDERRERYAAALELNQAYRGTVMVLSDVVEAEDDYTASHCRSVVELAAAVARELRLDSDMQQELEIAALLHDVGKIAIPNEILNKPAKLTDEEFELMKTHTLEGQALLDRVGGRLAKVGAIVRSCHERWDGRGYPDGLAGEQIPIAARIVFACDAWSAMTTDRPYRRAMSNDDALAELRRNSGSQFEPRVIEALEAVIRAVGAENDRYEEALRALLTGRTSASSPQAVDLSGLTAAESTA